MLAHVPDTGSLESLTAEVERLEALRKSGRTVVVGGHARLRALMAAKKRT